MKKALLLIDLQNDYFPGGKFPLWNTDVTLSNIVRAISAAQDKGIPIIHIQHIADPKRGIAPFFNDTLAEVIEELTTHRCGAVLIRNPAGHAAGVISKTDLVIAYKHGEKTGIPAKVVMRRPVLSCDANDFLSLALQQMLLKDVQRLFVYKDDPARIVGVLSLSDSARFRSGSCRACTSGRLIVGD